jgi:hypothetical protein
MVWKVDEYTKNHARWKKRRTYTFPSLVIQEETIGSSMGASSHRRVIMICLSSGETSLARDVNSAALYDPHLTLIIERVELKRRDVRSDRSGSKALTEK